MPFKNRYRFVFSLCAAIGFVVIAFVPTIYNPRIYDAMMKEGAEYWWRSLPHYPLAYWVAFLAIPIFTLAHWAPQIMAFMKVNDTSANRAIYISFGFLVIVLVSLFNFRWDPVYLFWGLSYGGIFGVIDGLHVYDIDFDFVTDTEMTDEAKIAKLRMMYDTWFKGLGIFTGLLIALGVSGAIGFLRFNPQFMGKVASSYANTGMVIQLVYIAPAIAIGIYGNIFQKISEIEAQHLKIKR